MITEYFWPQLDDMVLEDMWFQQGDVTSHTANLLETKFGERVVQSVGRIGNLTPLDYFLWVRQIYGLCQQVSVLHVTTVEQSLQS